MFMGIISGNPHETTTRPLGVTQGFKALLHMVNAIVYPAKEDVVSCILILVFVFFARGLAKCKLGDVITALKVYFYSINYRCYCTFII